MRCGWLTAHGTLIEMFAACKYMTAPALGWQRVLCMGPHHPPLSACLQFTGKPHTNVAKVSSMLGEVDSCTRLKQAQGTRPDAPKPYSSGLCLVLNAGSGCPRLVSQIPNLGWVLSPCNVRPVSTAGDAP